MLDNYQAEAYGILALNELLERELIKPARGISTYDLFKHFSSAFNYAIDTKTPEEAEQKATTIMDEAYNTQKKAIKK